MHPDTEKKITYKINYDEYPKWYIVFVRITCWLVVLAFILSLVLCIIEGSLMPLLVTVVLIGGGLILGGGFDKKTLLWMIYRKK